MWSGRDDGFIYAEGGFDSGSVTARTGQIEGGEGELLYLKDDNVTSFHPSSPLSSRISL